MFRIDNSKRQEKIIKKLTNHIYKCVPIKSAATVSFRMLLFLHLLFLYFTIMRLCLLYSSMAAALSVSGSTTTQSRY